MTNREKIIHYYTDDQDVLFADGLDDAIIGFDDNNHRVVYSKQKCVEVLVSEGEIEEDAISYLEYNTFYAYVGEKTPIFIDDLSYD